MGARRESERLNNGETQGPSDQPALERVLTLGMTSHFFSMILK